jgi:hypothetical protein
MALTYTLTKVSEERIGRLRSKRYRIDITEYATGGVAVTAATFGLRRIKEVKVLGSLENLGWVMQYIPTTLGPDTGDGSLKVVGSDDASAATLDEIGAVDAGEFRIEVLGY